MTDIPQPISTAADFHPMPSERAELEISTDPARMDVRAIHAYLSGESYWARGVPLDVVERSVKHSLCFGIFDGAAQVAFARVVTDRATFAYLCDVYVLEAYRGRGLGKRLMGEIDAHPELQGLRRWSLVTRDAHGLYAQFGFVTPARPERYMERVDPDIYQRAAPPGPPSV